MRAAQRQVLHVYYEFQDAHQLMIDFFAEVDLSEDYGLIIGLL